MYNFCKSFVTKLGVDAAGERVEQHGNDENGLQKIQQQ